jgi:phage terminase large subunit GpA-like protein
MESTSEISPVQFCIKMFLEGFRPPPDETIDEWADKNREISSKSSPEPGRWKTSRVPYSREIMHELSPRSHAESVVWMKGAQVAATENGLNFILYHIDRSPGPIMALYPTIDLAKKYSRIRLQPAIDANESLQLKVKSSKSRDSGNTILLKDFPGGTLMITGANSAAGLRSSSIRIGHFDEIDAYPENVDGEGDPLYLAEKRAANFRRKKLFYTSTPTVKGISRIEKKFQESDQRYYYVPCPICRKPQVIKWKNLRYKDDNPETVFLECEHCQANIQEYHKTWMLENGRWIKHNPKSKIPGFHLSALYSPLGWYGWKEAVREHINSIGDPLLRQVWVNTVLGEVWDDEAESTIDTHFLQSRCEKYDAPVPSGVVFLTAGGDVQDDRIEVFIYGWGARYECWLVDQAVFFGSPDHEEVWAEVDDYLQIRRMHKSGVSVGIAWTLIDSQGHSTDAVYAFCKKRLHRKIFAIKGLPGAGKAVVYSVRKNKEKGAYLVGVGTHQAKDFLYAQLKIKNPGPGYIHFPEGVPATFFEQLTAEKKKYKREGGKQVSYYELPSGKRNEALDGFVYALAALKMSKVDLNLLASKGKVFTANYSRPVTNSRQVVSNGVQI